jgi:anti-sigma B factor antagonist
VVVTEPLAIVVTATAGTVTVTISGELDLATAGELEQRLAAVLEDRPQRLVFDLAGVRFVDCAALRVIAGTGPFLPTGRPVVRRPSPAVRRMLALTGLAARCDLDDPDPAGPGGGMPEPHGRS